LALVTWIALQASDLKDYDLSRNKSILFVSR